MNWNGIFALGRLATGIGLIIYAGNHDQSSLSSGLDFSTLWLMLGGYSMVHPSVDRFLDSVM